VSAIAAQRKLVPVLDGGRLDTLPGTKAEYSSSQESKRVVCKRPVLVVWSCVGRLCRVVLSRDDDAASGLIWTAGRGESFKHRTWHSIGSDIHVSGANLDNLETHDVRSVR
jgi:hypothetical protein